MFKNAVIEKQVIQKQNFNFLVYFSLQISCDLFDTSMRYGETVTRNCAAGQDSIKKLQKQSI